MGRSGCGREGARRALAGEPVHPVPVAAFTWGFDYLWKVAEVAPWQLACGTQVDWHRANMALLERHHPDLLFYEGCCGQTPPQLADETPDAWIVDVDGQSKRLDKTSLALTDAETGSRSCYPADVIQTRGDVDRLVPEFKGWHDSYLDGLSRMIHEVGDRALVLPHHSPGYICACYAFGFEEAMTAMLEEPDLFRYTCDRYAAGDVLRMQQWREAGAEVCFIADSWASCDIISPDMIEEFALPYQRSITAAAHEVGLKIILWNEGDILPILEQEAAIPFDAFAFEQPRKGAQTTVDRARAVFGPDRCLFGNLDSELLLMRGDSSEIEAAVDEQLRHSGTDAPFILSTGSPLPSNIEPESVETFIRAVRKD